MPDPLDDLILTRMPHFIAASYQQMLAADSPQEKIRAALHVFELSLRALALGLISQYLIRDRDRVSDPYLNQLLLEKLPRAGLDTWKQLFFITLKTYEGNRDVFFIKELYDFYWDTSTLPQRPRLGVEDPFASLIQIRFELGRHRPSPEDTAGWSALCNRTLGLLREILGQLSFIQNYELIRVINRAEQGYTYERHVGLTVTLHQLTLPENVKLEPSWFYLSKQNKDFLLLDPLLIFWQDIPSPLPAEDSNNWDIAVFERFTHHHLQYLLSRLGKQVQDEDERRVADFVQLVYNTIRQIKQAERKAKNLTWWQLREVGWDISWHHMTTVQGKYKPHLYLQRNKVKAAFDDFLSSEKKGFILLGKSGVGKSNFILALADELNHKRHDVCLLLYDAATLNLEKSLTDIISQDFYDRLGLPERKIEHVWREIKEIDEIEQRTVLLCIDAINENPQGRTLLRQIYDLVGGPWPWLKIVVTSRPEAWRNIKYGIKPPAELLYREASSNEQAVEMEAFTYSQKLEPFSRDELPQVYEKYQQVYQIQTSYEALSETVKHSLRDPLVLLLVANTYQKKSIPTIIKKTEVISEYLQAMLKTGRLEAIDQQFLKEKLIPLMWLDGRFTNTITDPDIDRAGPELFEEINVETQLSDGRQVNQSFFNLLDAEILVRREVRRPDGLIDYEIAFTYERFYEYYLGQHIFETSVAAEKLAHYQAMFRQIADAPYTWGAVTYALLKELLAGQGGLIKNLALEDDRTVSGVLLDAIVDYGEIEPNQARQLLLQLIGLKQEALSAKRLAIEAASRLGALEVLEMAAKSPNRVIREMALLPVYSFWERNNQQGYVLLRHLAQETTGWLKFPRRGRLEFLVQVSLLIYSNHIEHDIKAVEPLFELWRAILEQFSWLMPSTERRWLPTNFVRKFITKAALNIVTTSLEANLAGEAGRSVPKFFKWPLEDREKTAYVAKFMDVGFGDVETIKEDILYLASRENGITHTITQGVLIMHLLQNWQRTLPVVKFVYEGSNSLWSRGVASGSLCFFCIISTEVNPQIWELIKEWKLGEWSSENLVDPGATVVSVFIIESKLGLDRSEFLPSLLDISASYGPTREIEDAVGIIAAMKVVGLKGNPQYALNSLESFLHSAEPKVQDALALTISRIELLYPDAVDYFRSVVTIPPKLAYKIKQSYGTATGGEILGAYTWDALTGSILHPQPRQTVISFANDMVNSKSLAEAVELAMEKIIYAIQGNPAA